jgi:RNA polymerase sigma factor (sigma-70 family)
VLGSLRGVGQTVEEPAPVGSSAFDDGGFAAFYRREYDRALRLAWLLTASRAAAEDVVQDAMAGVYRGFARIDAPDAYLRRSVVNLSRTWVRDERRHRDRASMLERERPVLDAADRELLDIVQRLPYRQRVVIVARYWGGWSEREIAQMLGCRNGTVKSLAARALDRLRQEVT